MAADAAENDNARLETELSSKSSLLSKLEYQHTKQTERLADVTQRFKAERKKRRALDARAERQRAHLESQETDISSIAASRDAVAARLAAIESSRSWRTVSAIARVRRRLTFSNQAELRSLRTEPLPPTGDDRAPPSGAQGESEDVTSVAGAVAAQQVPVSLPSTPREASERLKSKLELVSPRSGSRKLPVTALVLTWDVGHNPLGRSYMLAEVIDRVVRHTVVAGFQFPRYGKGVWEPLRNSRLPVIRIPGQAFPDFIDTVNHISSVVRPDIVIVCKPRLPSLQLGLRIKEQTGCPLILDIDDHELSFFQDQTLLTLDALESNAKGRVEGERRALRADLDTSV